MTTKKEPEWVDISDGTDTMYRYRFTVKCNSDDYYELEECIKGWAEITKIERKEII
jgi:hypothetical protein